VTIVTARPACQK